MEILVWCLKIEIKHFYNYNLDIYCKILKGSLFLLQYNVHLIKFTILRMNMLNLVTLSILNVVMSQTIM